MKLELAQIHGGRARVVDEARLIEMMMLGGWAHELGNPRARIDAMAALDELVAAGLPFACDASGARRFDAYQALNAVRWSGLVGASSLWRDRFVRTARQTAMNVGSIDGARRFELRIRRTIARAACGELVTVRVPVPLEGDGQSAIEVEPTDRATTLRRGDGWAEAPVVAGAAGGQLEVVVRATIDPTSATTTIVAPDEIELYTRHREGLVAVTPAIAELATRLAGDGVPPLIAIERFWRFLFERLRIGPIYHATLEPSDPLARVVVSGWSDCYAGAALLVALCRAIGIPARMVGGFFLYATAPTNHYWCEAFVPSRGWLPFDLACWELAAGDVNDVPWSTHFFGKLDYRLVTERLPRQFTSRRGLHVPPDIVILQAATARGAEIAVHAVEPYTPVYADRVEIDRVADV